jgi:hypothetical protein
MTTCSRVWLTAFDPGAIAPKDGETARCALECTWPLTISRSVLTIASMVLVILRMRPVPAVRQLVRSWNQEIRNEEFDENRG